MINKKLNKILFVAPIMAVSITPLMVSCNQPTHEHVFTDKFDVDEKGHLYHVCDICGEKISATDEEIDAMENKILVKKDGIYKLSDLTFAQIVTNVPEGSTIDIAFSKGSYEFSNPTNRINVHVTGLVHSDGEKLAKTYVPDSNAEGNPRHRQYPNLCLTLRNMNLIGAKKAEEYLSCLYNVGFQVPIFNCYNCYFSGYEALWATESTKIENSFVDMTDVQLGNNKTEYGFSTYGCASQIDIINTTFLGQGKCFKVYGEDGSHNITINLTNCKFNAWDYELKQKDKCAIEIDSEDVKNWADGVNWTINIKNCNYDDRLVGLYTKGQPHVIINEIEN